MTDLITRLREAIDEDERLARAAADAHIDRRPDSERYGQPYWPLPSAVATYRREGLLHNAASGMDLIERFPPARVLRAVAAKREILELHDMTQAIVDQCHDMFRAGGMPGERLARSALNAERELAALRVVVEALAKEYGIGVQA